MAALPPEALAAALGAVHKTGLNTDPNAAPAGSSSGGGQSAPASPTGQDPAAQGQDPNADPNADPAQQGADPQHQALWQLFPSTDPSWLQGLVSQGGDPAEAIGEAFQQRESDLAQFTQMQDALMAHLAAMFGAPTEGGLDQTAPPPQDPGVGGQGAGY